MKKGAPWLKTTLMQCAWAAARTKDSYFHAQYHRLSSRRGPKKAIGAVASSLLTAAYHMLKSGTLYQDLGANHFNHHDKDKQALHLIHRLKNLGFKVQITPSAAKSRFCFFLVSNGSRSDDGRVRVSLGTYGEVRNQDPWRGNRVSEWLHHQ
jgi:hypothetical protein